MNKIQQLYIGAARAAHDAIASGAESAAAGVKPDDHAAQSAKLNAFNAQGHNPLDYGTWLGFYGFARDNVKRLAGQKTASEMAAAEESAKPKPDQP
jgi:hypothetical protein